MLTPRLRIIDMCICYQKNIESSALVTSVWQNCGGRRMLITLLKSTQVGGAGFSPSYNRYAYMLSKKILPPAR